MLSNASVPGYPSPKGSKTLLAEFVMSHRGGAHALLLNVCVYHRHACLLRMHGFAGLQ